MCDEAVDEIKYGVVYIVPDHLHITTATYRNIVASCNCRDAASEHLHDVAMLCDMYVCVRGCAHIKWVFGTSELNPTGQCSVV